jgi:hypothetical protein
MFHRISKRSRSVKIGAPAVSRRVQYTLALAAQMAGASQRDFGILRSDYRIIYGDY